MRRRKSSIQASLGQIYRRPERRRLSVGDRSQVLSRPSQLLTVPGERSDGRSMHRIEEEGMRR